MPVKGGGGGVGGGVRDIVAGGASYVLKLKDGLTVQLDKVQKRVQAFARMMARVGVASGAAGGSIMAPITALFKTGADRAVQLDRLATKLGVSVEELSAFAHAAELAGVDLEGLTGDFENWAERVHQGAMGTGEAAEAFKRLGIDARALKLKNPIDQLKTLADAMMGVTNETERLGLLSAFGGDQFQWLNELLKGGSGGIDAAMAKAPTFSAEDAKNAREFGNAWTEATRALQSALLPLLKYITPVARAVGQFVKENAALVTVVAGAGAGLVAFGTVSGVVATAAAGLAAGVALVAKGVAALLSPVGLAAAAVGGLGYLFVTQTDRGREMAAGVKAAFLDTAATVQEAWGGITDALKAGDLGLAMRVALSGITVEWQKVELFLTERWIDLKDVFVEAWHDMATSAELVWNRFADAVALTTKTLTDPVIASWDLVSAGWEVAVDAMRAVWEEFGGAVEDVFSAVAAVVRGIFTALGAAVVVSIQSAVAGIATILDHLPGGGKLAASLRAGLAEVEDIVKAIAQDPDEILKAAKDGLANGNDATKAAADGIREAAAAEREGRAAAREKQLEDAKKALEDARAKFAGDVAEARGKGPVEWGGGGDWSAPAGLARQAEGVRGGFFSIGGAAASLGTGDKVAVQQLEKLRAIAGNAAALPEIAKAVRDIPRIFTVQ